MHHPCMHCSMLYKYMYTWSGPYYKMCMCTYIRVCLYIVYDACIVDYTVVGTLYMLYA